MSKLLKEPRKVDNEPVVKGECLFRHTVEPFDEVQGLSIIRMESNAVCYKYEVRCKDEDTASTLANLLRNLSL